MTFDEYKKIATEQAAVDYGIDAFAFEGGVHIFKAKEFDCRAVKTKIGTPFLDLISFGSGIVAVADERIIPFVKEYLSRCGQNAFRAFDAPNVFQLNAQAERFGFTVGEMAQGFLPSEIFEQKSIDDIFVLFGSNINCLYEYKDFPEALCYSTTARRRDVVAAVCSDGTRPIAVAACSNDGENMYQIGVDVLPEYRRGGLATRLVKRLTAAVAARDICPYYRCAWSNIPSRRTALASGYTDAWVELSFRPKNR